MITAHFSGEKISSPSSEAFSLYEKSRFGEKKDGKIEYSLAEALFLVAEKKMKVIANTKEVDSHTLMKKAKKHDKRIETKLASFSDLRKKGYIVKSALKFGADFRVYDRGIKPSEDHAKWILYAVREHDSLSWGEFAAKNRIAHSTRKNLLLAIVDEEGDVSYYEVSWTKP
ncbi:tRNA-intron lyase [Candidatus Pacearchaeota archaeon]|nr:tRNA-intron lyase [Candidatus Pacearchaeota archaeon]